MKVGVVGLGRMGSAMAARLIEAGHDLTLYDPVPAAAEALGRQGARVARDLADLCVGREVVLSMLPTDAIFETVVTGPGGLADSLPKGAIHMVSGTHGLPLVQRLAAVHADAGQVLIAANVLGRPERAVSGQLGFITGGPAELVKTLQPLLDVMGSSFVYAGETPEAAVVCKLANSFVLGCAIEAMGEGIALTRKYGVDADVFHHVLSDGLFNCVAYHAYGDVISKEDWGRVGATVTIGMKDTDLAFEAARQVSVPLPAGEVYREHLVACQEKGESDLDWSVMAREQFRRSGLE
jgi:3-hydroxyisobutyrate dehydrogenase-like beta-hydroxyacid dehydrogenase